MIYICKKKHPVLTVGKQYVEKMPYPNTYNAFVENDNGYSEYFPRNEFFDVVSEDEHEESTTSVTINGLTLSGSDKEIAVYQDRMLHLEQAERDFRVTIELIKKCFPCAVACDSMLLVYIDDYNELVKHINNSGVKTMIRPKQKKQIGTIISDGLRAEILAYAMSNKISFDDAVIRLIQKGLAG